MWSCPPISTHYFKDASKEFIVSTKNIIDPIKNPTSCYFESIVGVDNHECPQCSEERCSQWFLTLPKKSVFKEKCIQRKVYSKKSVSGKERRMRDGVGFECEKNTIDLRTCVRVDIFFSPKYTISTLTRSNQHQISNQGMRFQARFVNPEYWSCIVFSDTQCENQDPSIATKTQHTLTVTRTGIFTDLQL